MKRIVIVGAGAAGLMAAIFAAGAPHDVQILERKGTPGRKILISGGGRCNVLPSQVSASQYHTDSSRNTFKKIFQSWPLRDQHRFFEETLDIPLKVEPDTGKVFPVSNRASDILNGLLREALARGARLRVNSSVEAIRRDGQSWQLTLESGSTIEADAVIFSTGGLSVPQTGADGTGLRLVQGLGHTQHTLYPALTPLLTARASHHNLAGLSLPVTLYAPLGNSVKKGEQTRGGFLFTHRGYSGPSVLDLSHCVTKSGAPEAQRLLVQWSELDPESWDQLFLRARPATMVRTIVRDHLPERLANLLVEEAGVSDRTLATLRRDERLYLVELLSRYALPYSGNEGYRKAEVTGGGIPLEEIIPSTMESRRQSGLYLCGEMLDVFGPIGGYNFVWAWITGRLAGLGARRERDETIV